MNIALMRAIRGLLKSDSTVYKGAAGIRPAAFVRLLTSILCILLCALSRNAWFTVTVIAYELVLTAMKPPEELMYIIRPVLVADAFAAVFSLPAVFLGSPGSFGTILMKVTESVLVLSRMNSEVSWKEVTAALGAIHIPQMVIATLDQTIRFLVILERYTNRMLEAVSLRRVGRKQWRNAGTGGIVGTSFLKTHRMARLTADAMACRGFTGEFAARRTKASRKQVAGNLIYLILIAVMVAAFIYTQKLI